MKCNCGREIENKTVQVFGDLSTCHVCAAIDVVARKTACGVAQAINELYALKGEAGMASLREHLHPTLKQFQLI